MEDILSQSFKVLVILVSFVVKTRLDFPVAVYLVSIAFQTDFNRHRQRRSPQRLSGEHKTTASRILKFQTTDAIQWENYHREFVGTNDERYGW